MPGTMLPRLQATVRQLTAYVPEAMRTVTFANRAGADAYTTPAVSFTARREPMVSADTDGLARTWAKWHLYAVAGQSIVPKRGGKITDGSDVWHVVSSVTGFGGLKHDCDCVLEV